MAAETKTKILVVDDDNLMRDFYRRILSSKGYQVTCAANGDEAIEILTKNPDFALAIIDLLMPIRTGWELIEYMRSADQLKYIPIVAMTGLSESHEELAKVKNICEATIQKGDFDIDTFEKLIISILKPGS